MKRRAVIAALVALGAFSLGAFAQEKPAEKPRLAAPAAKAPLARVKEALQLTPEQEAKLKEFHKARQTEAQAFGDQMKKLRQEMQALRQDGKADPAKMDGLIDQVFKLQAERAKAGLRSVKEREKIFTPEQLEKMKQGRQAIGRMGLMRNRMGMAPGAGMRTQGRMGMRPGMRMQPGMSMRPGQGMNQGLMMRGRMGMRPGQGMNQVHMMRGRMGMQDRPLRQRLMQRLHRRW